jgi:hypothetical protein
MLGNSILIELRVLLNSPSCNGSRMVEVRHDDIHVGLNSTELRELYSKMEKCVAL